MFKFGFVSKDTNQPSTLSWIMACNKDLDSISAASDTSTSSSKARGVHVLILVRLCFVAVLSITVVLIA